MFVLLTVFKSKNGLSKSLQESFCAPDSNMLVLDRSAKGAEMQIKSFLEALTPDQIIMISESRTLGVPAICGAEGSESDAARFAELFASKGLEVQIAPARQNLMSGEVYLKTLELIKARKTFTRVISLTLPIREKYPLTDLFCETLTEYVRGETEYLSRLMFR